MWKSAYVGVYQLLNWKMHGETLKDDISVCDFSYPHSCTVCFDFLQAARKWYLAFHSNKLLSVVFAKYSSFKVRYDICRVQSPNNEP